MTQSSDAYAAANGSGATVRAAINADLQALNSNNSGSSGPASTVAAMWWPDTTTNLLKQRDTTNASWIKVRKLNGDASVDVASASTCDIGADGSKDIRITGTTTITSLGTSAPATDTPYFVRFAAALTLTQNATSLILPGAANIITAAGDSMLAMPLGSGNWQILAYNKASGLPAVLPILKNYLAGGALSNDAVAPNTKINVAAGQATDDTNAASISWASTLPIDCTTTGAGGLDTGALAASKCYHAWVIWKADGTTSGFADRADLAGLSPTLPSGYIFKRRDGSFFTDASAHIIGFQQIGDRFRLNAPALDGNNVAVSATYASLTITAPLGVVTTAFGKIVQGTSNLFLQVRPVGASDGTPSQTASPLSFGVNVVAGSDAAGGDWMEQTNTSSQIQLAGSGSGNAYLTTEGWFDPRGRI